LFALAASPISVELAQQALALRPGSYALVVSTEVVTQSIYKGTQRSMQVANVLFR
jgi:3-ketoacyl-CoA synthase